MPSRIVVGLALCSLAAPARSSDTIPSTEIVERILAVVDGRPLLLSEVRAVEVMRDLDRPQAIEAAIDERLMYQEAARLPQAAVSDEDTEQLLEAVLERRPELTTRVAVPELRRVVRRQAAILKYVDFRFRPQVRIEEGDLRSAWNEGYEGQPQGPPFEEASPALRARLERQALDRRIEDWIEDLRGRADIRYVEGPGSASPEDSAEQSAGS